MVTGTKNKQMRKRLPVQSSIGHISQLWVKSHHNPHENMVLLQRCQLNSYKENKK